MFVNPNTDLYTSLNIKPIINLIAKFIGIGIAIFADLNIRK
jgi:hypothetical protein